MHVLDPRRTVVKALGLTLVIFGLPVLVSTAPSDLLAKLASDVTDDGGNDSAWLTPRISSNRTVQPGTLSNIVEFQRSNVWVLSAHNDSVRRGEHDFASAPSPDNYHISKVRSGELQNDNWYGDSFNERRAEVGFSANIPGTLDTRASQYCVDAGYGQCPNNPDYCCPIGGRCCSSYCCKAGSWCYGTGCCLNTEYGCDQLGCMPPNAQCCRGGNYCPSGYNCVTISGVQGCCPIGKICSIPTAGSTCNAGWSQCAGSNYCCPTGDTCYVDTLGGMKCASGSGGGGGVTTQTRTSATSFTLPTYYSFSFSFSIPSAFTASPSFTSTAKFGGPASSSQSSSASSPSSTSTRPPVPTFTAASSATVVKGSWIIWLGMAVAWVLIL